MKLQGKFKVINADKKTGTTNDGRAWEIVEYVLESNEERDDGSLLTTKVPATTTQSVGELKIGAEYDATLFVTSREYNNRIYVSFRVTRAELTSEPKEAPKAEVAVENAVDDEIPF